VTRTPLSRSKGQSQLAGSGPGHIVAASRTACYRQDAAKRQSAGIKFTHRPKINIFAMQGRLVAPIQVKFVTGEGTVGPRGCIKFRANRCRGGNAAPKDENFHILVKSRTLGAKRLTDFHSC